MPETTPYPLPQSIRQSGILAGDGGATYGPFAFKVFDLDDVSVYVRDAGSADQWTAADFTAAKATTPTPLELDDFTITFDAAIDDTTEFVVVSERLHEREAAITRGGALSGQLMEKELSKQGSVLQELRRDVDRAHKAPYGSTGGAFEGGDIAAAQGYAEDAAAAKTAAEAAQAGAETAQAGAQAVLDEVTASGTIRSFASYAALRAFSDLAYAAKAVIVLGTIALSIHGGGLFLLDESATAADDDGAVELVDAAGRKWRRAYAGAVNLDWSEDVDPTGAAESTAGAQRLYDKYGDIVGTNTYELRGLWIHSTDKGRVDFSAATITNYGSDTDDAILLGDDPSTAGTNEGLRNSFLRVQKYYGSPSAGHFIRVKGTVRGMRLGWGIAYVRNPVKSALYMRQTGDSAQTYDLTLDVDYTEGHFDNTLGAGLTRQHQVPLIDIEMAGATFQANRMDLGFSYGSSYSAGAAPVPFARIHSVTGMEIEHIRIRGVEIANGGVLDLKYVWGCEVDVAGFDAGNWFGHMVKSEAGKGNTFKVQRKAGTRTATFFTPYDIDLVNEVAPIVYAGGFDSATGKQWINFNGGVQGGTVIPMAPSTSYQIDNPPTAGFVNLAVVPKGAHAYGAVASGGTFLSGSTHNTASISKPGTGQYQIALATPVPNTSWPAFIQSRHTAAALIDRNHTYRWIDTSTLEVWIGTGSTASDSNFSFTIPGA